MIPNRAPVIPTRRPLVRRPVPAPLLRYRDVTFNPRTGDLRRGERTENLTYTERRLLAVLMRPAGQIRRRGELLDLVWGEGSGTASSTLDSNIARLRRKLDAPGETKLLHTAHGTGYVLSDTPFPTGCYGGGR